MLWYLLLVDSVSVQICDYCRSWVTRAGSSCLVSGAEHIVRNGWPVIIATGFYRDSLKNSLKSGQHITSKYNRCFRSKLILPSFKLSLVPKLSPRKLNSIPHPVAITSLPVVRVSDVGRQEVPTDWGKSVKGFASLSIPISLVRVELKCVKY